MAPRPEGIALTKSWPGAWNKRRPTRRLGAPARAASTMKPAPSAARPLIQVAERRRWAGAAGGGGWGRRLDRVEALWGMEQRRQKMPDPGVSDQGCDLATR